MKKVNAKRVLRSAKADALQTWQIVSYSIDKRVLKAFKAACKRHGIQGSQTVEIFMREFIKLNRQ